MKAAHSDDSNDVSGRSEEVLGFEDWYETRRLESPQFGFWYLVLAMELTILTLIWSFRKVDFRLCCEALSELIRYFFTNNNFN